MNRRFLLPYGRASVELAVPEEKLLGCFEPNPVPPLEDVDGALRRSLLHPSGGPPLREMAAGKQSPVIVIDDSTRPVPNALLLDAVMEELLAGGVRTSAVTVIIATGLHRPNTEEEIRHALGPWHGQVSVENHDARNDERLVRVGTTSLGTELRLNRTFVEADLRILTGDVDHHQFCGYGGGAKSIFPGLADAESIRANHSRMDCPGADPGEFEHNPVRQEIEESARLVPIDFLLAVVLNPAHQVVGIHAGDLAVAYRDARRQVDQIYRVHLPELADLVIASPGGHPKDGSLYQAQKALEAAVRAVRPGGNVVLAAACPEGSGSALFEEWMEKAFTPDDVIDRIQNSFVMGGHKAYQIAREVKHAEVHLYSELPPGKVRSWFMHPLAKWQDHMALIDRAQRVTVLPQATLTLTEMAKQEDLEEIAP